MAATGISGIASSRSATAAAANLSASGKISAELAGTAAVLVFDSQFFDQSATDFKASFSTGSAENRYFSRVAGSGRNFHPGGTTRLSVLLSKKGYWWR